MKIAKRYLALVLSFALFVALPLAFTQEAAAASKTKILQPSAIISTASYGSGRNSTEIRAYAYNDKGLNYVIADEDGYQKAMVYNKSGYMTSSAKLDKKGAPYGQAIYDVKKGKVKSISKYNIDGAKVTLTNFTKNTYKNGKLSQELYSSADGKISSITYYRKDGTRSKYVYMAQDYQEISVYDKYGNITSNTEFEKLGDYSWTTQKTYKNTYKSGKLVKTAWTSVGTSSYSSAKPYVVTGLSVYTYKKGKLVKADKATVYPGDEDFPSWTDGYSTTYAYTKGGLIKSISETNIETYPTESKVYSVETTAFQYKKVAVNTKCADAVKEAMKAYSYEKNLPSSQFDSNKFIYTLFNI